MKRRLLIVAVFLLAGVVVNVAVAWGCAIWSSLPSPGRMRGPAPADLAWWQEHAPTRIASEPILLSLAEAFGCEYRLLTGARDDAGINLQVQFYDDGLVRSLSMTTSRPSPLQSRPWDRALRVRAGWPLSSMAGERWRAASPVNHLQQAVHAVAPRAGTSAPGPEAVHVAAFPIQRNTAGGTQYRLAPLRPIWPGFAVNTIFYAMLLWLLIPGPFVLRRFIRMKRGRCVRCGYPMGESAVCSECGKALPTSSRSIIA